MKTRKTRKKSGAARGEWRFRLGILALNSLGLLLIAGVASATGARAPEVTADPARAPQALQGWQRDSEAMVACAAGLNPPEILSSLNQALSNDEGVVVNLGQRPDGAREQRRISRPFKVSQPTSFPDRSGNTYICVTVSKA